MAADGAYFRNILIDINKLLYFLNIFFILFEGGGMSKQVKLFFCIIGVLFILPQRAYAYIDPGTGSVIIQFIIGAIFGGIALLKIFWHKISKGIKRLFRKDGQKGTEF